MGSFKIAIQCKGFEKLHFDEGQEKQCKSEIQKYLKKGPQVDEYWLVINRDVTDSQIRKGIESELQKLVSSGKAAKAHLYDLSPFLKKLRRIYTDSIRKYSESSLEKYIDYYSEILGFVEYIEDVPFSAKNGDVVNPSDHLISRISAFYGNLPSGKTGNTRSAPRFILKSSFGFGKTSALHAIALRWLREDKLPIFLPAARLGPKAFAHGSGIAEAILEILLPEDTELDRLSWDMLRDVLRREIAKSDQWIILVDGLDENASIFAHTKIGAFWGGLFDLGAPVIVSVRDEVANLRPDEILDNPSEKRSGPPEIISLTSWTDELILEFLNRYGQSHIANSSPVFDELCSTIRSGQYDEVYGDIPKRPLFLGMMAQDAAAGISPNTKLHVLYGSYFRRKFEKDCFSVSATGISTRYSDILNQFGRDEACERLIILMQEAASRMLSLPHQYQGTNAPLRELADTIDETELRRCAQAANLRIDLIEDLVMHSLLQPAGRELRTRNRLFRFAHRSFQEWFISRSYAVEGRPLDFLATPLIERFYRSMRYDIENQLSLP